MMTFLDSVLGFAVQTVLEAGETYVSLSTEVKFVRPLLAGGGQVRAIGELVSRSTRTATATAVAEDRQGRIIGTGTSTCFIQRSEEHTSELQSLMRISYAVFCLKKKNHTSHKHIIDN